MKDAAETGNLSLWNKFQDIDTAFVKPITGKPYKGTSPNPQYIIRCLTEMFGPVGKGFGWTVLREDFQPLGDEVLHWCRIQFWWSDAGKIASFEAYGQTKALMKTKNGMMLDEDAPKKSLTDAIVKAASHIGIAANIFLGRWDDQKYVAEVTARYRAAEGDGAMADQKTEGRDPRKVADGLLSVIAKVDSEIDLDGMLAEETKFTAAWDWLNIEHKPMAEEVMAKFNARKMALSSPPSGPGTPLMSPSEYSDEIPY